MQQTIHILIKGKVQGVYFRQSTKQKADELGISGEVRNLAGGDVSIQATGTESQLQQLIAWCRQGPPRAVVTTIETETITLVSFSGFSVRR
jgi:acylphosphatase